MTPRPKNVTSFTWTSPAAKSKANEFHFQTLNSSKNNFIVIYDDCTVKWSFYSFKFQKSYYAYISYC